MKTLLYFIFISILLTACNQTNTNNNQVVSASDSLLTELSAISSREVVELELDDDEDDCGYRFFIEPIGKKDFDKFYSEYYREHKPKEIVDFDSVKKLLGNVVEWIEEQGEDENGMSVKYGHPVKINFRNGKTLELIDDENLRRVKEFGWTPSVLEHTTFASYFPEEDILFLNEEGYGDDGEQSYILATGDSREVAGNPRVTYFPPTDTKHRIRGFYNGYVMRYYYQEKRGRHYINLRSIDFDMQKVFFTSDSTFYFEHQGDDYADYRTIYKKITIADSNK